MSVAEVTPSAGSKTWLPGAQFADAYRIEMAGPARDAKTAAMRIMLDAPTWFRASLSVRNALVAPLGLKTSAVPGAKGVIGLFPLVSETPERVVVGFDDRHLDFRIIVEAEPAADGRQFVTSTTLVRTHNLLGRCYLAIVKPFHRVIARALLRRAADG
ncbi:MAG TPA: DUF2867 domain-containing protein [Bradyrhizobium sp.]|nr:DUF2867 domain-containing protein [Bradyrhizobium sp.]